MLKRMTIMRLGFAVFSILVSLNLYASEIEADSRIKTVTVYSDSAWIERTAQLKLNAGEHEIIFPGIVPEIDENSLKVSAQGDTEVKLFGAQIKKEFLEEVPSEKVKQLGEEIQKTEDEIKRTENIKGLLLEEKDFLDSIRLFSKDQIPKDLVTKMPPAKELEETLRFLDVKLKENNSGIMEAELNIRELNKKLDVLRRELANISGPGKKLKRYIVVGLEVLKPGNLDLNVSYLVRGARWQPVYDARADFDKSQVELVSYGTVRQNTGEDWQDVEIYLSTAKPSVGGRMPYISPWLLRIYKPEPAKLLQSREFKISNAARATSQYEAFYKDEAIGGPEEEEIATTQYAMPEEKGIAVVYKLAKKATVKSDGSENKLPISSQTLSAKFEYSSYPRAVLNAYLGSRVTNAKDLQLLAGRVNIFLAGDFMGASSIDNVGPSEEFDLYLGADENVKVKREQIGKKVDETLVAGIPSPTKRTTFKYKLSVENYKSKKINVKLFEAMPVSEDERIKVKIEKASLEPKEKDWKDRKGVWLWELELDPNAKQEIIFTLIIDHPRDMQVEGL